VRVASRRHALGDGDFYQIRVAEPLDAGRLLDLHFDLCRTDPATDMPELDEFPLSADIVARDAKALERTANGMLLAAIHDRDAIGSAVLRGGRFRRTRHVTELSMRVRKDWRRRGVGRALLDTALEAARASDVVEIVSLTVFLSNAPALELYRSAGFQEEGRRRGHLRLGDRDDDLVLMSQRV